MVMAAAGARKTVRQRHAIGNGVWNGSGASVIGQLGPLLLLLVVGRGRATPLDDHVVVHQKIGPAHAAAPATVTPDQVGGGGGGSRRVSLGDARTEDPPECPRAMVACCCCSLEVPIVSARC